MLLVQRGLHLMLLCRMNWKHISLLMCSIIADCLCQLVSPFAQLCLALAKQAETTVGPTSNNTLTQSAACASFQSLHVTTWISPIPGASLMPTSQTTHCDTVLACRLLFNQPGNSLADLHLYYS